MRYLLILLIASVSFGKDVEILVNRDTPRDVTFGIVKSVLDLNKSVGDNKITFVNATFSYKIFITYVPKQKETIAGEAYKTLLFCKINLYPNSFGILKTTVWHEIGHCLGLGHDGVVGKIMSEKVKPFSTYPGAEVSEFLENVKEAIK